MSSAQSKKSPVAPVNGGKKTKKDKKNKKKVKKQEDKKEAGPGKTMVTVMPKGARVASDVLGAIDKSVAMCPQAINSWALAIITRMYMMNTEFPNTVWQSYYIMEKDFRSIATNGVDVLTSRLAFVNFIHQAIKAKTCKGNYFNMKYNFNNVDTAPGPSPIFTVRGYNYYMFDAPSADAGIQLAIQTNPSIPSDDIARESYTLNLGFLSSQGRKTNSMFRDQPVSESSKVLINDGSAYASRAPYANTTGSCPSGGYSSAEDEVYAKCLATLSVFAELASNNDRTAHEFEFASGDTCSAYGYPFLDGWKMLHYSTKKAPIFKYVNFAELWCVFCGWVYGALLKGLAPGAVPQVVTDYLAAPIPYIYMIIAFRQSLLRYFAASQACAQFQAYTSIPGVTFEALRVSSNTVSKITTPLVFPAQFVENCRMLEAKIYQPTGKNPERFAQAYIPVLGYVPGTEFLIPTINIEGVYYPIFSPPTVPAEASINYVDGSSAGVVFDLNSTVINSTINRFNDLIANLSPVAGPTGLLEGSSNFTLLSYTRYDEQGNNDLDYEDYVKSIPQWAQTEMFKERVRLYEAKKKEYDMKHPPVVRTKSQKNVCVEERPPFKLGAGLESVYARGYSSYTEVTNEMKSVLYNMVVPSVLSWDGSHSTSQSREQMQTTFSEGKFFPVSRNVGVNNIGGASIENSAFNVGQSLAPGIAAKPPSEVSEVLRQAQIDGNGGFLQALFAGVSAFASNV